MKTFNVYRHPTRGFEAVKIGFSWPAFFFGIIWMLVKKLWGLAGLWFVACVILKLIELGAIETNDTTLKLGVLAALVTLALVFGFNGNLWREKNLLKRGFKFLGKVQCEHPDGAVAQLAK